MVEIGMYGYTEQYNDAGGNFRVRWIPGETVRGEPYHTRPRLQDRYSQHLAFVARTCQSRL